MKLPLVKLLTRPGCEACSKGKFILRRLKLHVSFDAKVVNILKSPEYMKYNDVLPVILVEEELVCKSRLIERDLRESITQYYK